MTEVEIRTCEVNDIVPLEQHLSLDGVTWDHKTRFEEQIAGKSTYLIATKEDLPVGGVVIRWEGIEQQFVREQFPDTPGLLALLVREDSRSQGIGTSLVLTAEEMIREKGFQHVGLAVGIENTDARRLYERLGYVDTDVEEFFVDWTVREADGTERPDGEMCRFMIKALQP